MLVCLLFPNVSVCDFLYATLQSSHKWRLHVFMEHKTSWANSSWCRNGQGLQSTWSLESFYFSQQQLPVLLSNTLVFSHNRRSKALMRIEVLMKSMLASDRCWHKEHPWPDSAVALLLIGVTRVIREGGVSFSTPLHGKHTAISAQSSSSPLFCIPGLWAPITQDSPSNYKRRGSRLSPQHAAQKRLQTHKDLAASILSEDTFPLTVQLQHSINWNNWLLVQVVGKSLSKSSWLPSFLLRYSIFYSFLQLTRMLLKELCFCWIFLHLSV